MFAKLCPSNHYQSNLMCDSLLTSAIDYFLPNVKKKENFVSLEPELSYRTFLFAIKQRIVSFTHLRSFK